MNRLKLVSLNAALLFLVSLSVILVFRSFLYAINYNTYYVSHILGYISILLIFITIISTLSLIFFADKNIIYFFGNIILLIIIIATFNFTDIPDYSWDGMAYHLPSILFIHDGWNPIRDPNVSLISTNSYPNGFWTLKAIYGEILGNYEYGKALNGFLVIVFCVFSIHITDFIRKSFDKFLLLVLINSALISNITYQFFGNYLDGSVYIIFSLYLIIIFLYKEKLKSNYIAIILSSVSILLINTKTSGLYFAALGLGLYLIIIFRSSRENNRINMIQSAINTSKLGLICFIFGVILVGWRPWITNLTQHDSFFYPDPHETISAMAPDNLKDYNFVKNITYAIYACHADVIPPNRVYLKWPFAVNAQEFNVSPLGPRSGGFGPLFSTILTLTLIARLVAFLYYRLRFNNIDYAYITIFCACAVLPGSWWARFIPILYLVPILISIRLLSLNTLLPRFFTVILIVLLGINFVPTIIAYQHLSAYALYVENTLKQLHDNKTKVVIIHNDPFGDINSMSHIVWSKRLTAHSVPHRITKDSSDCSEEILTSAFVNICRDKS